MPPAASGDMPRGPWRWLRPSVFVALVWALMTVVLFAYVWQFAIDLPRWDAIIFMPVLTGDQPVDLEWIFRQHSDHRIPASRLLGLLLLWVTGGDFRGGTWLNAAVMSAVTAGLLLLMRRLRGRLVYADAALPLATLHFGQAASFLWGFQVAFVVPVGLLALVLVALASRPAPTARSAWLAGGALVLLPMWSAPGLVPVLPMAAAAVAILVAGKRWGTPDRARRVLVVGALLGAAVAGAFALLHERVFAPSPCAAAALRATLQVLGQAVGPAGGFGWSGTPMGIGFPPLFSIAVTALLASVAALAAVTWQRQPQERPRATCILALVAGVAMIALAIGTGRSALSETAGLSNRYITIMIPAIWLGHVTWELYAPPGAARFVQTGLFALFCALLTFNTQVGFRLGRQWRSESDALYEMVRRGEPREEIAERFAPFVQPDASRVSEMLDLIERADLGPYRR